MLKAVLPSKSLSHVLRKAVPCGRRIPFGSHCTAKLSALLLGAVLVLGLVVATADDAFARTANTWRAMFDLQPGITYTYALSYEPSGRGPGAPPWVWFGPGGDAGGGGHGPGGRSGHGSVFGELSLYRSGGVGDEVRFWFTMDGVRVNGTAANDPQAVAGAVLVAALTNPEPISPDGLRLLATVFHWTNWRDLFERSTFRSGTVWNVVQHPPHQFTARRQGFSDVYHGEVTRGRDTVLEITIDLARPLPLEIVALNGRDRYMAALQIQEPVRGPRR